MEHDAALGNRARAVDPSRYQFTSQAFKSTHDAQQLQGVERPLQPALPGCFGKTVLRPTIFDQVRPQARAPPYQETSKKSRNC